MRRSNCRIQQPVEATPLALKLPEVTPEIVDPPMPVDVPGRELPVVLPALPVVVLPVHGPGEALLTGGTVIVAVTLGDGTVIIGLKPPLSISVAPSGMLPLASDEPGVAPGVKSGDALPVDDTVAEDPELQPLDDVAPPSKVKPAEGVVDGVI